MLIYKISTANNDLPDDGDPLLLMDDGDFAYVVLVNEEQTSENTLSLAIRGKCVRSYTIDEYRKFLGERFDKRYVDEHRGTQYIKFNSYVDEVIKYLTCKV